MERLQIDSDLNGAVVQRAADQSNVVDAVDDVALFMKDELEAAEEKVRKSEYMSFVARGQYGAQARKLRRVELDEMSNLRAKIDILSKRNAVLQAGVQMTDKLEADQKVIVESVKKLEANQKELMDTFKTLELDMIIVKSLLLDIARKLRV